jgi:hypothetical protein
MHLNHIHQDTYSGPQTVSQQAELCELEHYLLIKNDFGTKCSSIDRGVKGDNKTPIPSWLLVIQIIAPYLEGHAAMP